jgi:fatty acid/phospholipid biosynthesis enzyme
LSRESRKKKERVTLCFSQLLHKVSLRKRRRKQKFLLLLSSFSLVSITMARSSSNAKVISGLISRAINGRGFSADASQGAAVPKARSGADAMVKKTGEEVGKSTEKTSWVPDPRTGFYRPENVAQEIDAAELRATLLKKH